MLLHFWSIPDFEGNHIFRSVPLTLNRITNRRNKKFDWNDWYILARHGACLLKKFLKRIVQCIKIYIMKRWKVKIGFYVSIKFLSSVTKSLYIYLVIMETIFPVWSFLCWKNFCKLIFLHLKHDKRVRNIFRNNRPLCFKANRL